MGRNREIEKEFIKALAKHVKEKKFIIESLVLIDTDNNRKKMISYLNNNNVLDKKTIENKMFYLSIEQQV